MKQLFNYPTEELQQDEPIYITITQNLHTVSLTDDKDRIQFDNLLNDASKKINEMDLTETAKLQEQLKIVKQTRNEFVNHSGSLVIYITPNDIYYYHLGVKVTDHIYIDKLPYILPLAENFQFEQDYHLLAISRENARIFEGHGQFITELDMTDEDDEAPVDLETALGTDKEGGNLSFGTYDAGHGQAGTQQFFHGHGDASQEKDIDRERYFRIVDRFVSDHYSNDTHWPLVLFTVEENSSVFQNISRNDFLSDTKIDGSTTNLTDTEIKERVSDKINNIIDQQKENLITQLNETPPKNRIENIPDDLASASLQGQIDTLYIKKYHEIPGTITEDGLYEENDNSDNFILLLVNKVINTGGQVYIIDSEDMPKNIDVAARLRF